MEKVWWELGPCQELELWGNWGRCHLRCSEVGFSPPLTFQFLPVLSIDLTLMETNEQGKLGNVTCRDELSREQNREGQGTDVRSKKQMTSTNIKPQKHILI